MSNRPKSYVIQSSIRYVVWNLIVISLVVSCLSIWPILIIKGANPYNDTKGHPCDKMRCKIWVVFVFINCLMISGLYNFGFSETGSDA